MRRRPKCRSLLSPKYLLCWLRYLFDPPNLGETAETNQNLDARLEKTKDLFEDRWSRLGKKLIINFYLENRSELLDKNQLRDSDFVTSSKIGTNLRCSHDQPPPELGNRFGVNAWTSNFPICKQINDWVLVLTDAPEKIK